VLHLSFGFPLFEPPYQRIGKTMKALQITRPREFRIVEMDRPSPAEGEIVVRLEFAAICNQNDYKIFYGLYGSLIKYPCDPGVYGHEGVGVVVEAAPNVVSPKVGDRVIMMLEGGPMLYREYVTRLADTVVTINKKVPVEQAAVLELFGCAHHCSEIAGDLAGARVVVSGLGPAGLAITQMIRAKNPREIVGVEMSAERAELARQFGVSRVFNPNDPAELAALIREGADMVIDATGAPQGILNAFEITRKEVVIFGFTNQPFEVDQSKWFQKEMVIKNSKVQTISDLRAAAGMLEAGQIDPRPFISGKMPFTAYDKAVEKVYRKEAIKILLYWE